MPNVKKITHDWSETGKTLYCIIRREADSYRLNDADGAFAAAPADPFISLAEDAVIKGRYELVESRTAWNDGLYTVAIYRQAGGAPSPGVDTIIGAGSLYIRSDVEVFLDASIYAVKGKTDALPATPAAVGDKMDLLIDPSDKLNTVYNQSTYNMLILNDLTARLTNTRAGLLDNLQYLDAPITTVNYNASNALSMLQSGIYGLGVIAGQVSGANSGINGLATHNEEEAWHNALISAINSRVATGDSRLDTITAIMDKVSNLSVSSRVIATLPSQVVRPASGEVYLQIDTILYNSNGNLTDPPDLTDPGGGPTTHNGFGILATRQDGSYVPLYKDALGTPLDTVAICHHASGLTPQIMTRSSLGNYGFYLHVADTTELGSLTFKFAWFDIAPWQVGYDITSHRKELRQTVIVDFTGINTVINLLQDPVFGLQRLDTEIDALMGVVGGIPTTPLLRTDGRLDHLDADISLATAAIADGIYGLAALRTAIDSRLDSGTYVAPENSAIQTILDLLVDDMVGLAKLRDFLAGIPVEDSLVNVRVQAVDDGVDFTTQQKESLGSISNVLTEESFLVLKDQ